MILKWSCCNALSNFFLFCHWSIGSDFAIGHVRKRKGESDSNVVMHGDSDCSSVVCSRPSLTVTACQWSELKTLDSRLSRLQIVTSDCNCKMHELWIDKTWMTDITDSPQQVYNGAIRGSDCPALKEAGRRSILSDYQSVSVVNGQRPTNRQDGRIWYDSVTVYNLLEIHGNFRNLRLWHFCYISFPLPFV